MSTCEEHGDAILVYDGYSCPACDYIDELNKQHSDEVGELEDRIMALEQELEEAQGEV